MDKIIEIQCWMEKKSDLNPMETALNSLETALNPSVCDCYWCIVLFVYGILGHVPIWERLEWRDTHS